MVTNILFTIKNLDTAGMKYVLADIVLNIDRSKYNPIILVGKRTNSGLENKLAKSCKIHEVNFKNPGALRFLPYLLKIKSKIKQLGNIGHSFDYSSDWFEALCFKCAGIPLISEKTNLSVASYRWNIKLGLSSHIVCLSKAQLNQLDKWSNKVSLIPTGIDIVSFDMATTGKRNDYGFTNDDIILICVAHMVEVKGHEDLIRAFASVTENYPQLKLFCVGTGSESYINKLKKLVKSSGIENKVVFYGGSENVASLYKLADGKILATRNKGRREAYGAVIAEAMVCGLPVIATKSGGPEDLVLDGITGWLVDGEGFQPLSEGIHKFMAARNDWNKIGSAGRKRAIENYNLDTMIEKYSNVYNVVAKLNR